MQTYHQHSQLSILLLLNLIHLLDKLRIPHPRQARHLPPKQPPTNRALHQARHILRRIRQRAQRVRIRVVNERHVALQRMQLLPELRVAVLAKRRRQILQAFLECTAAFVSFGDRGCRRCRCRCRCCRRWPVAVAVALGVRMRVRMGVRRRSVIVGKRWHVWRRTRGTPSSPRTTTTTWTSPSRVAEWVCVHRSSSYRGRRPWRVRHSSLTPRLSNKRERNVDNRRVIDSVRRYHKKQEI